MAGNSKFEQRIYPDALVLYTKAINLAPQVAVYRLNRAACYSCMGRYNESILDCQAAIRLDPQSGKAYKRQAKAHCELGEFAKAVGCCEEGRRQCGTSSEGKEGRVLVQQALDDATELHAWYTEGLAALDQGDCSLARTFFANMLQKTHAPAARLALVKAELGLGLCDQVRTALTSYSFLLPYILLRARRV